MMGKEDQLFVGAGLSRDNGTVLYRGVKPLLQNRLDS